MASLGVSMVEFALVAPVAFLMLFAILVIGLLGMNEVGLNNLSRDVARAGGVCGSANRSSTSKLPDGTACAYDPLKAYLTRRLGSLPSGAVAKPVTTGLGSNCDLTPTNSVICVWTASHTPVTVAAGSNPLDECAYGDQLEVITRFDQQLYLPIVSSVFATSGTSRAITSDVYSACEQ